MSISLQDDDDDVRYISAETLIPVVPKLKAVRSEMAKIASIIWDLLTEMDDLRASVASLVQLLCKFSEAL
jgi:hypothetical protein